MKLEVRVPPPKQETFGVEAAADETVKTLKARIAGLREGWTPELNVILQGRHLASEKTLSECGLKDGDFVVITGMTAVQIEPPVYDENTVPEMLETSPLFSAPLVTSSLPIEQTIDRT